MEKKQTHVKYGFITGAIMAVLSLALYATGLSFKPGMSWVAWLTYIPFLAGIIMNAQAYSKENDGFITFGNAFGSCFKATMIIALVIVGYSLLTIVIFPEMKEKIMEMQRTEMAKNPKMTEEMIDTAISMTTKFWNVIMVAGALAGTLFIGAIFSLIGAAVAKKKDPALMTFTNN